jgi:hypothetical protein
MSLLTHQIVVPSKLSDDIDRPFTQIPLGHGFVWHLCPLILSGGQFWVLVSAAFGYVEWIEGEISGEAAEQAVVEAIQCNEPPDREEDCISVNLDPKAMSWRISDEVPVHVGTQLKRLQKALRSCRDLCDAEEAIMDLNEQRLKVGSDWIKPRAGMQGLMEELADQFVHYLETTPFWKQIWAGVRGRHPWLDG